MRHFDLDLHVDFEALVKTPEGRVRAKEIYAASRPTYHSMTTVTVDQILAD